MGQTLSMGPRNQIALLGEAGGGACSAISDGCVARFRGEESLIEGLGDDVRNSRQRRRRPSKPRVAQESTACCQRLVAWNSALARGRKPGGYLEELRNELGPLEWMLGALISFEVALPQRVMREPKADGSCARMGLEKRIERPEGALESVAAEGASVRLESEDSS